MKTLLSCLPLLLIGFASSSLYAQYPELEKQELKKNKIKDISEYSLSPCDFDREKSNAAQWKAGTWASLTRAYDSRGNLISEQSNNKWYAAPVEKGYWYDDKDSLVEQEIDYFKSPVEHKFTLNDKGKILEDTYSSERHTFKYNAAGDVIETAVFRTSDGGLYKKTAYNDKGDMTEALVYDAEDSGSHLARVVYTYDGPGHRTKGQKYDLDGHLYSMIVYTYDETGHNTKEEERSLDGKTLKRWSAFKRDSKGLVTESSVFNSKGECTWLTKTTYHFYP